MRAFSKHALRSLRDALHIESSPIRSHRSLLPLPARHERGEGWGEGLFIVLYPAVSPVTTPAMFYLHFRNEFWKLFGKKRTYIGFGAFVLVQTGMLVMFRFSRVRENM